MCYALVWLRRGLAQPSSPRHGFLLRLLIIIIRKRTHATIQYIYAGGRHIHKNKPLQT